MGIVDINDGRKFVEKTEDERAVEEWERKLKAIAHGERVKLTDEEKTFAIAEMDIKFKGDKLNLAEAQKWNLVFELARELKGFCPELYDIHITEPRDSLRGGMLLLSLPVDHTLNERETRILSELLYFSNHLEMSVSGMVLTMVFNFPDLWNNSWDD